MSTSNHHPLAADIRSFIDRAGTWHPAVPLPEDLIARFDELALALHDWQQRANPVLTALHANRCRPSTVMEIPAVPCEAFRQLDVTCLPPDRRTRRFVSSGTTGAFRSRHWHNDNSLALYEHSLWRAFQRRTEVLSQNTALILLTPSPDLAPESSLVHMLGVVAKQFGRPFWFAGDVAAPAGAWQLSMERLRPELVRHVQGGSPVALIGTAFHFVHLTDHLESIGSPLGLPAGSWIMETGGYKGRSRALPRAELLSRIHRFLGVPSGQVLGEYGMCELGSQAYDEPGANESRTYRFPPWAMPVVISPEDAQPVPDGGVGLLQVLDLANAWSAVSIRTQDLVRRRGDGFELLGRARQSQPRGCSLQLADLPQTR